MTMITARKHKIKTDGKTVGYGDALGLTLDSYIHSPRLIANGRGAFEGTIRDLFAELRRGEWRYPNEGIRDIEEEFRESGILPPYSDDDEEHISPEGDLEDAVHALTYGHLCGLLDDPNVVVVTDD